MVEGTRARAGAMMQESNEIRSPSPYTAAAAGTSAIRSESPFEALKRVKQSPATEPLGLCMFFTVYQFIIGFAD